MIPVRCIFGMAGHGKTTLLRQLIAAERRVMAWDPDQEHQVAHLGYEDFAHYLDAEPKVFRVGLVDDDEYHEDLCALAWAWAERNRARLVVVLEEAEEVAPPGQEKPIVKKLIRRGRHFGVEVFACSRRPAEVSRRLTSQAPELFLFATQEPRDLTYLREFVGPAAAELVAELPKFHYVHWQRGGGSKTVALPPVRPHSVKIAARAGGEA